MSLIRRVRELIREMLKGFVGKLYGRTKLFRSARQLDAVLTEIDTARALIKKAATADVDIEASEQTFDLGRLTTNELILMQAIYEKAGASILAHEDASGCSCEWPGHEHAHSFRVLQEESERIMMPYELADLSRTLLDLHAATAAERPQLATPAEEEDDAFDVSVLTLDELRLMQGFYLKCQGRTREAGYWLNDYHRAR